MNVSMRGGVEMLVKRSDNKYYIDGGFSVIGPADHEGIEPHTHDFAEFVYVFHGRCVHCVDGREYPAQKGDLLFINYKSVHSIRASETVNYADVLLKTEFIDESLKGCENAFSLLQLTDFQEFQGMIRPDNCFVHFSGEEQKQMEQLILWAGREMRESAAGSRLTVTACLNLLLTMIFRKMALPMPETMRVDQSLLSYIKTNCSDRLPMALIAQKCGYSEAYFSRLFRRLTGMTYTEYLFDCRIEKACMLLGETDRRVDDVIQNSGFSDRTKFFKRFGEKVGMTPNEYRKMSKSNTKIR